MIVPATDAIVRHFYEGEVPRTVTAYAVVRDEEPVAIAGFYLAKARRVAFADGILNLSGREKVGLKRAFLNSLNGSKLPLVAEADPEVKGSTALMEHLGFYNAYKNLWLKK